MTGIIFPLFFIGVEEPQTKRAFDSVYKQKYGRFDPVIHKINVSPQSKAMNEINNEAVQRNITEWSLWLSGDMILAESAIAWIDNYMRNIDPPNENTIEYTFGLWDTFLEEIICGCPLRRMDVYSNTIRKNVMRNDFYVRKELEKQGYEFKRPCKHAHAIGTHFDNPDEFQVFRRFKARGIKSRKNPKERNNYLKKLKRLRSKNSDNKLYEQAVSAFLFGFKKASFIGAHDITIDEIEYQHWKKNEVHDL